MKNLASVSRIGLTIFLLVVVWRNSIWPVALLLTILAFLSELVAVVINSHERRIKRLEEATWTTEIRKILTEHKEKHSFTFKD